MINNTSMGTETIPIPPSVSWAQRKSRVFLTFNVECEKPEIKIEKQLISFKGVGAPEQKLYEVKIALFGEVDPEKSTQVNKGRLIELVLAKENTDGAFWPALTSDKKKHHWLRIDFNRWQDEEEHDVNTDDMLFNEMGNIRADGDHDETSSNEDEDLPDLY